MVVVGVRDQIEPEAGLADTEHALGAVGDSPEAVDADWL